MGQNKIVLARRTGGDNQGFARAGQGVDERAHQRGVPRQCGLEVAVVQVGSMNYAVGCRVQGTY